MILDLTKYQETLVLELAREDGKSPAQVLIKTATWLQHLSEDEQGQRALDERLAEADQCTDWISQAQMDRRVQQMLRR